MRTIPYKEDLITEFKSDIKRYKESLYFRDGEKRFFFYKIIVLHDTPMTHT